MLSITITSSLTPIAYIKFRGNGMEFDIPMVVDTGFDQYLSLAQSWIDALGFSLIDKGSVTLSDGTQIPVGIYEATIEWEGQDRLIPLHSIEGDGLIGMSLMAEHLLNLPVRVNESGTLTPLP